MRARNARRRLWTALAAAALLALGAPLHQHGGAFDGAASAGYAAGGAPTGAADAGPCFACQVGGRARLALPSSSQPLRTPDRLALRLQPAAAPALAAAAARGPAPPRGPPSPSA